MKSLKGLKNTISSYENEKLSDLANVNGGKAQGSTVVKSTNTTCGNGCVDRDEEMDSGKTRSIVFHF